MVPDQEPSTAVVPAPSTDLALGPEHAGAWGAEGAESVDIVLPRLMLMQGLSDFVKQRKAQMGDIINSLTMKPIGSFETPIPIIPLMKQSKEWLIDECMEPNAKNKIFKFKERLPWTPVNDSLLREELANGILTRRTLCLNFFVLLPSDIEGLPYLISFRKTSYKTGAKLSTHFTESQMKKAPPARKVFLLGAHEKSRDSNSWYEFDLTPDREATKEELGRAWIWYNTLKKAPVKVDDSEDKGTSAAASGDEEVPF